MKFWVLHPEQTLETSCPSQQGWAPCVAQALLITLASQDVEESPTPSQGCLLVTASKIK